jgi:hypothetical protein
LSKVSSVVVLFVLLLIITSGLTSAFIVYSGVKVSNTFNSSSQLYYEVDSLASEVLLQISMSLESAKIQVCNDIRFGAMDSPQTLYESYVGEYLGIIPNIEYADDVIKFKVESLESPDYILNCKIKLLPFPYIRDDDMYVEDIENPLYTVIDWTIH